MKKCHFCGGTDMVYYTVNIDGEWVPQCSACKDGKFQDAVLSRSKEIKHASDFASWSKQDMSEAFWIHLGRYKKHPNKESLNIVHTALSWACHDDHGLSNSFHHALGWCNIDLFEECFRNDLPEKYEQGDN